MEFKLEDLCTITSSKRIYRNEYVEKGISFYRGKEIIEKSKGQLVTDELYISIEKYNEISKKYGVPKKGDILITGVGTIGISYIVDTDEKFYFKDGNIIWLKDFNEKINNQFLYIYLKSNEFKNEVERIAIGSTQRAITIVELKKLKIKIPSLETQNKIVKIYNSINKKIELNNQINDNLQKLINNLFTKFFVDFDTYKGNYKESDLGMIPEKFDIDTLGHVISFSNGYGWDSKDMVDKYINNSYKVFKMGNINIGGGINKSKTKSWIIKDKVKNLEQYISKKGDILMWMTDMKNSGNPLLGHTALIDKDNEFVINQRVGILRCDKKIGYSYIYTMSNLPEFINDIRSRANSGVQVNLTTKGICDTLVLVPDNNTLLEFENVAIPLYEQIFNNNNENESLEQLRDTLLPKLMNGEIELEKISLEEI